MKKRKQRRRLTVYRGIEDLPGYLKTRGMCQRLGFTLHRKQRPDAILDTRWSGGGGLYPLFDIRKLEGRK